MNISRRAVLQIAGLGMLAVSIMPRVAFAARNTVKYIRTGAQPNNKTRLVIETALRPSYSIEYGEKQLFIIFSNTVDAQLESAKLSSDALVKSVSSMQIGDKLKIIVGLKRQISEIKKNQIMILEPNGDNEYRLVLDFAAGNFSGAQKETVAKNTDNQTNMTKKRVIVIDAGHGGKDPGCIGAGGTKEKTVVLSVAKKLKSSLYDAGFTVYMTRNDDTFLKLSERSAIGEKKHADLFLSIHANANPSRDMKGFSVYTLSEKASDEEAQKLADAENAADKMDVSGFEQFSKDIRVALSALQQHAVAEMSEEFANNCAKSFNRADVTQQKGPAVRHAPLAVLRSTVPSALIELGHLSNASEEKLLKNPSHQNKLVSAIVRAVKNYNFEA